MTDALVHNWNQVNALRSAMAEGEHGLSTVPDLVLGVLDDQSWREFVTKMGEHVQHERFIEFVDAKPMAGLGASIELVQRIVKGTPAEDAVSRQLEADGRQGARTDLVNNVHEVERPQGNHKDRALRKLRKDAPELHADVLAGHLSAHAAMVKAGYRPRTITVSVSRPESVANALRKHMAPNDLARLIALLQPEGGD